MLKFLLFVFPFFSAVGQDVKLDSLLQLEAEYLAHYQSICNCNDDNPIKWKDMNLNATDSAVFLSEFSYSKAPYSEYEPENWKFFLQERIFETLDHILEHENFKPQTMVDTLEKMGFQTAMSEDFKLMSFSISEKTGGTYRSRMSAIHYTEFSLADNSMEIFDYDGYFAIHLLKTDEGDKYVLQNYVRGCSYCFLYGLTLVAVKNNHMVEEFSIAVNSRSWDETVQYHPESQTIEVKYVTDDLTEHCLCDDLEKDEPNNELEPDRDCACAFQFNGVTFEKVIKRR